MSHHSDQTPLVPSGVLISDVNISVGLLTNLEDASARITRELATPNGDKMAIWL
ncbi:MAG: hypothetical protein ACTJLL_02465 [Anaplasma sp.]